MWFSIMPGAGQRRGTTASRPGLSVGLAALSLAALSLLTLSGCGGGGGINSTSVSSLGFRIVPAGGTVTPLTDSSGNALVSFGTQPGAVNAGVQVSVAVVSPTSSPAGTVASPVKAYLVGVSPDNPTINVNLPITLTVAYTSVLKDAQGNPLDPATTFHMFYLPSGGASSQWIALPNNTVVPGSGTSGTVTATIATIAATTTPLTGFLKSGTYAIFATSPPPNPFP